MAFDLGRGDSLNLLPLRPELRAVLGVRVPLLLDTLMVVATGGGSAGPLLYFSAVRPAS
jgi:hypothetical protein